MVVLQVADIPCTTNVDGLEILGYSVAFYMLAVYSGLFKRNSEDLGEKTYAEKTGELPGLELSTRPLFAEQPADF